MTPHPSPSRERGAVLVVALLFLVVLTMLGVTAMTGTTFEERMAGNARDLALANQAAEAALREARDEILGIAKVARDVHMSVFGIAADPADKGSCNNSGLCRAAFHTRDPATIPPSLPPDVNWASDATTTEFGKFSNAPKLAGLSRQPRYTIELLCINLTGGKNDGTLAETCRLYRFTALGWGRNPNTQAMIQEVFIKAAE
ncbi:MAG TPA: pilus assembly protein [Burkholderiales bacterium]|nr:pilus assembly protein [Burkholderiales bacterium]